jgi:hypothetical protein
MIELVRRAGLEPATSWVETRNSGSTELTPRMTGTRTWDRTKDLRFVRAALCQLSYACACGELAGQARFERAPSPLTAECSAD